MMTPFRRPTLPVTGSRPGGIVHFLASIVFAGAMNAQFSFLPAGNLTVGRNSHTAAQLANGKVLIVGGKNARHEAIAGAEIHDPANGTVENTGSLNIARHSHHATLLPNRKVLVTGHAPSAEIYDPLTGSWSITHPSDGAAGNDSATLLQSGNVLVIGGMDLSQKGIVRIYHPLTDTWTVTGPLQLPRKDHTAILLADGRVLVCGGMEYGSGTASPTAEIFNQVTGVWTGTGQMLAARHCHTASLLPDGRVIVVGGKERDALSSVEIFDPTDGQWSSAAPLSTGRYHHTASLLKNGTVLVTGGVPLASTVLATAESYNPATGQWAASSSLGSPRCLHAATPLNNGNILITGGWGDYGRTSPGSFDLAMRGIEEFAEPLPEIIIALDGLESDTPTTIDFGKVTIGSSAVRKITVRNSGTANLTALNFRILGANAGVFDPHPSTIPSTLAPKASTSLEIRFNPFFKGPAAATLTITSDDSDERSTAINLTGDGMEVLAPEISVEQPARTTLIDGKSRIDFGKARIGKRRTRTFVLRNTGNAVLSGLSIKKEGNHKKDFIMSRINRTSLSAGAIVSFKVRFRPNSTGRRRASIRIFSNDKDESPFDIKLSGKGRRP